MAYITFQPSDYFNTKLYTGNSSTNAVTGVGFQPDFVWLKPRNLADHHRAMDAVRTASYFLSPNQTSAQSSTGSHFASFDSDGFTLGGSDGGWNNSSYNYVTWNWKANGSGSANTDGSISSTVSANTTAGFSIVTYTGTGSNATVGHGLNSTPELIFTKRTNNTQQWFTYTSTTGSGKALFLDSSSAESTQTTAYNSSPTSTVINYGSDNAVNGSSDTYVAYCFHSVKGFSKIGSYVGNASTDGTFVYTGFKPALLIRKRTDAVNDWYINDNKRAGYNPQNDYLFPNSTQTESALQRFDFLSNGFKIRTTDGGDNASGGTYIYMAFAEEPLVSSNEVPATAR